jgi:hypothetical protein
VDLSLFHQFMNQANSEVLFGIRNTQMAWVLGVHKDMVGALRPTQNPSIALEQSDEFMTFHGLIIHTIHMNRVASLKNQPLCLRPIAALTSTPKSTPPGGGLRRH